MNFHKWQIYLILSSDKLFVSNRAKEYNWITFHTIKKKTLNSNMVAKYSSSVTLPALHPFLFEKVPG